MSVINQMLKDLQDRRAGAPPEAPVLHGLSGPTGRARRSRTLFWLILIILIATGTAAGWYFLDQPKVFTPIAVRQPPVTVSSEAKADLVIHKTPPEPAVDPKQPARLDAALSTRNGQEPDSKTETESEPGSEMETAEPPRSIVTRSPEVDAAIEVATGPTVEPAVETAVEPGAGAQIQDLAHIAPTADEDPASAPPEISPAPRVLALSPQPVIAKPGYQTITLNGQHIPSGVRAWINWGENGDGKFLMPWQVKWQDAETVRLVISTGLEPDRWSVVLYGQGNSRSEPFEFLSRTATDSAQADVPPQDANTVAELTPAGKPAEPNTSIREPVRQPSIAERARRAEQRADAMLRRGRYAEAEAALRLALDLQPARSGALASLVGIYLRDGRHEQAEQALMRARRQGVSSHDTAMLLARTRVAQNRSGEALLVLSESPPAISDAPEYHALMAALYQRANDHARAADIYRALLGLSPGQANWWMGLAISLHQQGEGPSALQAYRRARDLGGLTAEVQAFVTERIRLLEGAR